MVNRSRKGKERKEKEQPNKKETQFTNCPECGCKLNQKNLDKHLLKVHGPGSEKGKNTRRGKGAKERLDIIKRRKQQKIIYAAIATFVLIVIGGILYLGSVTDDNVDIPGKVVGKSKQDGSGEYVYVEQSGLEGGTVKFYNYLANNGKDVRYLCVKDSAGEYHSAIDLCQKLHPSRSGWVQEQDYIMCKDELCYYPINAIGSGQPGCCMPVSLPFETQDGQVLIKIEYLEEASQYF